jgi:hypothetical protein
MEPATPPPPASGRARRWLVLYPRAIPLVIFLALAAITANGPIAAVLPNSNSPAILTEGLALGQFTEALFGWAPSSQSDVTRYGKLTAPAGLVGLCYLDGFCGAGQEVGTFDIVPTGNTRALATGKALEAPHVGLGFDDQTILWADGYEARYVMAQ